MKAVLSALGIAILASTTCDGAAYAAKLCKLTGTYTDEYGIATANIKGKKGQLVAPDFCATPYNFKITNETLTGFTVTGSNKTKSCGTFSTNATFMGSCDVFGGTVTINGQHYADVFTKQSAAPAVPETSAILGLGLK